MSKNERSCAPCINTFEPPATTFFFFLTFLAFVRLFVCGCVRNKSTTSCYFFKKEKEKKTYGRHILWGALKSSLGDNWATTNTSYDGRFCRSPLNIPSKQKTNSIIAAVKANYDSCGWLFFKSSLEVKRWSGGSHNMSCNHPPNTILYNCCT